MRTHTTVHVLILGEIVRRVAIGLWPDDDWRRAIDGDDVWIRKDSGTLAETKSWSEVKRAYGPMRP